MTPHATASPAAVSSAEENQALRSQLAYLLEQAELNHSIMMRHQAFDLEIVGATTFSELVGTIFRTLPQISGLESVTLSLVDEDADIRTVMERLGVDFTRFPQLLFARGERELGFVSQRSASAAPPRPVLGPYDAARHGNLFGAAASTCVLQSVALVPLLRNRRLIGCLNLGSVNPDRFTPQLGTDFIEHMASIIAICLENVISNEMLKYIGLTDALTGVYNRRYIDRRLLEEIARARRQDYRISFMYIDIDHFKHVNDTVGHQGGDEVLRETAGRIKHELRLSDALARFGGEEFVVLLIDADLANALPVAERIRASIAATPFTLGDDTQVAVTVSIGVASLGGYDPDRTIEAVAQRLIADADAALYRAKDAGRNRVLST